MLKELFENKKLKPKAKVERLSKFLLNAEITSKELIIFAKSSKDPVKASCIEAFEFTTKINPSIADASVLKFVTESLSEEAPRIKWESARVIGNIAKQFPGKMSRAVTNLLDNSEHQNTVVRWSTAFALSEILKHSKSKAALIKAVESIVKREEKNSIRKIYQQALKTVKED